jgi:hypothetical protein
LKSLRIRSSVHSHEIGAGLGRLVSMKLQHLSELVLEHDETVCSMAFGARGQVVLHGLGTGWTLAPVTRVCGKTTLRFVAHGLDRAEYSCYVFEDKFFTHDVY